jgi:predicted dehydrogenase
MDKVSWLLVGAGDIAAKRVASALGYGQNSRLAAVCDLDRDRAQGIAQKFDVPEVYTDYSQALNHGNFEAVYLATPIHLHVPQALQAMAAGKHTLVEKPMGIRIDDGKKLVEAADRSDLKIGCAYYRRLYPAFTFTKNMLEWGEMGQLVLGNLLYHSWFTPGWDDPKYWRVIKAKSGGGPLVDMGSHMFDVLIGLVGLPERVFARATSSHTGWDVEDTAAMVFRMPDGALITAGISWHSQTWQHQFELVGTDAKVTWLPFDSGNLVKTVGRTVETLNLPPATNVHGPLVDDFVRAILNNCQPVCPINEAYKTDLLLHAIYRSAELGIEVKVSESDPIG